MQHHAIPHPPNNYHITNDTNGRRRHVHTSPCAHDWSHNSPPIPHDTTLTTLWKLLLLLLSCLFEDTLLTFQIGGKANRESCIDHATAGQIDRHVETKVTKRSQERKGMNKTRGRPSLGMGLFLVSKWTEAIPGVSGAEDTFWRWEDFPTQSPGTRWEKRQEKAATPGWFSWSGSIF